MELSQSIEPPVGVAIAFYDAYNSSKKCFLSTPLHIFQTFINEPVCHQNMDFLPFDSEFDIKSWRSVRESVRSLLCILPTLIGFILSRFYCRQCFLWEFPLITLPIILSATVGANYNDHYCGFAALLIIIYLWRLKFWKAASNTTFQVGKHPIVFTLLRATAYIGTCAGILAIDFPTFPKDYRKSRTYGAALMDLGIGLFVVTMGIVSHRARNLKDLRKLPKMVLPLLVLGLARTLVLTQIDYYQDEHEYGVHMNAFFTLGLTKLFGMLISLLVSSDAQLLPLSLGILFLHETVLQLGLSDYVMCEEEERDTLWAANREGLSSLPGSIALYLFCIYFAKWYTAKPQLSYMEMRSKLCKMLCMSICGWFLVFLSAYAMGIARVTFNTGYNIWLFTVCITLLTVYTFVFEFALAVPIEDATKLRQPLFGDVNVAPKNTPTDAKLPIFVQTLNMNGLTHFMLSNFLTGFVNIALEPEYRNSWETVLIMTLYMLASSGTVYFLYCKGIRIA